MDFKNETLKILKFLFPSNDVRKIIRALDSIERDILAHFGMSNLDIRLSTQGIIKGSKKYARMYPEKMERWLYDNSPRAACLNSIVKFLEGQLISGKFNLGKGILNPRGIAYKEIYKWALTERYKTGEYYDDVDEALELLDLSIKING